MFVQFNPSPVDARVGDCTVRALSKALCENWETVYLMLCVQGYAMFDMPNATPVVDAVLRRNGFVRGVVDNTCPDCYTVGRFAKDHPTGTYVVGTGNHIVTIVDGDLYDTWDSSEEIPIYFWHK